MTRTGELGRFVRIVRGQRRPASGARLGTALLSAGVLVAMGTPACGELTSLRIVDYATMPMTGAVDGTSNAAYLARVNFMAEEPGGGDRFFVNDLNGPLYILDKNTKQFTTYLNFNGRADEPWMPDDPNNPGQKLRGMFPEFVYSSGYANGLITFQFDPDYRNNGKFYTVHMEQPNHMPGTFGPDNTNVPGLNAAGYTTTTAVTTPGGSTRATVLIEWTDTDISNTTFEGSARELLRLNMAGQIHPMGDLIFNPTAQPGDPDWRVMYISIGDGGAGEAGGGTTSQLAARRTPQLLNTLGGKILRIIPDLNEHTDTSTVSPNGRYRIPNDNPFTGLGSTSVRDEIWANGLRNPHRMAWDVDPADSNPETNNHLIVSDIGLNTWEELNIIHKGQNYGYSQREGPNSLSTSNVIGPVPNPDIITQQICTGSSFTNCTDQGTITPLYPVAAYGHEESPDPIKGDSISSGYVYRGSKIPQLYGKFLFGEITTGQILYADYEELLAADDGDPSTMAEIHSLNILWDSPTPGENVILYTTDTSEGAVRGPLHHIVRRAYAFRGGQDADLPGAADVTGPFGRADIRIQIDEDGELYILSKSDGMIRQIVGPPRVAGDYDHDGDVDAADYDVWSAAVGTTVPVAGLWADGNEDGNVDTADYVVWRHAMPTSGAGAALLSVPEPAGVVLLAMWVLLRSAGRHRATWRARPRVQAEASGDGGAPTPEARG